MRSPLGDCPLWGVLGSLTLFLKWLGKPEMPSYLVPQSYSGVPPTLAPSRTGVSFLAPVICLTASTTESLSSFWVLLSGERGDLGVISPSDLSKPHVSPVAASLPNPCPSSLSSLMGDGDPVECPRGIRESLGGPNCGP